MEPECVAIKCVILQAILRWDEYRPGTSAGHRIEMRGIRIRKPARLRRNRLTESDDWESYLINNIFFTSVNFPACRR